MEELDNLEGIGMDRAEVEAPKPKRERIKPQPVVKAKNTAIDKVKMFYVKLGGDTNRIAAQTGLSKQAVEQIIRDEKL